MRTAQMDKTAKTKTTGSRITPQIILPAAAEAARVQAATKRKALRI